MASCNVCKTKYNGPQRQKLISEKIFWCPFCCRVYKIFNPLPATYFTPELNINDVIEKQKTHYQFGKSTGWYKN